MKLRINTPKEIIISAPTERDAETLFYVLHENGYTRFNGQPLVRIFPRNLNWVDENTYYEIKGKTVTPCHMLYGDSFEKSDYTVKEFIETYGIKEDEGVKLNKLLVGYEGHTFYSPTFGDIILKGNLGTTLLFESSSGQINIPSNGIYVPGGELCVFPSKDQRDWAKWEIDEKKKVPKKWSDITIKNNKGPKKCQIEESGECSTFYESPEELSALALLKILTLIEAGYEGQGDEFTINRQLKIVRLEEETSYIFAFKTKYLAEEFLSHKENIQLIKALYGRY